MGNNNFQMPQSLQELLGWAAEGVPATAVLKRVFTVYEQSPRRGRQKNQHW
jgi:hypothetical protein